jgi:hypothetical protein
MTPQIHPLLTPLSPTMSTEPPLNLPDYITLNVLRAAKGAKLRHWISHANATADRKVLTQQARVDDLRMRLAEYYRLDLGALSMPAAPIIAPLMIDEDIKARQFAWARELRTEWERTASKGREFRLTKRTSESGESSTSHNHVCVNPSAVSACTRSLAYSRGSSLTHEPRTLQRQPWSGSMPLTCGQQRGCQCPPCCCSGG